MGKKNNREHKPEVEYLREENKRLKSELRHLKKELGKTNKKVRVYEEHIDLEEPEMPEVLLNEGQTCVSPGCTGRPVVTNLGIKSLIVCSDCGYRKTVKNGPK
jgi:hypothetical protein